MTTKLMAVRAIDGHCLEVTFDSGETRLFDATPYLNRGIFAELQDPEYFKAVRLIHGGVAWPNEQDLSADTLYLRSQPVQSSALQT